MRVLQYRRVRCVVGRMAWEVPSNSRWLFHVKRGRPFHAGMAVSAATGLACLSDLVLKTNMTSQYGNPQGTSNP